MLARSVQQGYGIPSEGAVQASIIHSLKRHRE